MGGAPAVCPPRRAPGARGGPAQANGRDSSPPRPLPSLLQWWGALIVNRNFTQTDTLGRPIYVLKCAGRRDRLGTRLAFELWGGQAGPPPPRQTQRGCSGCLAWPGCSCPPCLPHRYDTWPEMGYHTEDMAQVSFVSQSECRCGAAPLRCGAVWTPPLQRGRSARPSVHANGAAGWPVVVCTCRYRLQAPANTRRLMHPH